MPIDFRTKQAEWKDIGVSADIEHTHETRAIWLTVTDVKWAAYALSNAAGCLAELTVADEGSGPAHQLLASALNEFDVAEASVMLINVAQAKTDARYAGSKRRVSTAARAYAETVADSCAQLKTFLQAFNKLTAASERFGAATSPARRCAVAKHGYVHTGGGESINFYEGGHFDFFDRDGSDFVRVSADAWSIGIPREIFAREFDIVDCC